MVTTQEKVRLLDKIDDYIAELDCQSTTKKVMLDNIIKEIIEQTPFYKNIEITYRYNISREIFLHLKEDIKLVICTDGTMILEAHNIKNIALNYKVDYKLFEKLLKLAQAKQTKTATTFYYNNLK